MRWHLAPTSVFLALVFALGCGASVPPRYVHERDLGDFQYRRYQKVLDLEFPVEGNTAVGHTASYIERGRSQEVVFATAFVTVYEHAASLTAEVADRLDSLGTYEVTVGELEGEYVWWLDGGDDRWALWVSGNHVVKLGAPRGQDIPEEIADKYIDTYPSDLDEHGRAEDGSDSAGPSARQAEAESEELDMPEHLREGAVR